MVKYSMALWLASLVSIHKLKAVTSVWVPLPQVAMLRDWSNYSKTKEGIFMKFLMCLGPDHRYKCFKFEKDLNHTLESIISHIFSSPIFNDCWGFMVKKTTKIIKKLF